MPIEEVENAGLLSDVDARVAPRRLWFLSEAGADLAVHAGGVERRPKVLEPRDAAGALRAHTLAVNDAAICFVRAARERGDEFGPLSWRHEVAHPLSVGRGRRRRTLFADAVLTYLHPKEKSILLDHVFLELDRASLSVDRLALELSRYADLYRAVDSTGRQPGSDATHPSRVTLHLLRRDPQIKRTPELQVLFCRLEDLEDEGPFAPIFRGLAEPGQALDWRGDPCEEASAT